MTAMRRRSAPGGPAQPDTSAQVRGGVGNEGQRTPMRRHMRAASVAGEALRNLASGTSRAALWGLLAAIVLAGLAGLDIRSVVGLSADAAAYRDSGAAVYVLQAQGAIDPVRCEALGQVDGVVGAGASREAGTKVSFEVAPRSAIGTVEATPGLAQVLGITPQPRGLWLSDAAAGLLGVEAGTVVPTSQGRALVGAVYAYPEEAGQRELAYSAVMPVPATGEFSSCWVKIWPHNEQAIALVRWAYAGGADAQIQPSMDQLNTKLGAQFDGAALFAGRPTALAGWVCAALGLALGFVAVRARRLELAGALHAQVPKGAQVAQVLGETAAWVACAVVISLPVTYLLAAWGNPDPVVPTWLIGLRVVGAGALAIVVGAAIAASAASERRLFTYFRNR